MWQDRLIERDGYKPKYVFEGVLFNAYTEEYARKILPFRFFSRDIFYNKLHTKNQFRRYGYLLIAVSIVLMSFIVYMSYHCHKASCSDCYLHIDKFNSLTRISLPKGNTTPKIPLISHALWTYLKHKDKFDCQCSVCIYNFIWNAETHFEKCYYSLTVLNTLLTFLVIKFVAWLSFLCFKHTNIN